MQAPYAAPANRVWLKLRRSSFDIRLSQSQCTAIINVSEIGSNAMVVRVVFNYVAYFSIDILLLKH